MNADGYADILVGALSQNASLSSEGKVYLYLGGPSGPSSTPDWTADPTNQANAQFGVALAGVGDVNGDGYGDVVIGAGSWDGAQTDEGRVYLYAGEATGRSLTLLQSLDPTDESSAEFGASVGAAGDVNGDGYADVIIGAWGWDGATVDGETCGESRAREREINALR